MIGFLCKIINNILKNGLGHTIFNLKMNEQKWIYINLGTIAMLTELTSAIMQMNRVYLRERVPPLP